MQSGESAATNTPSGVPSGAEPLLEPPSSAALIGPIDTTAVELEAFTRGVDDALVAGAGSGITDAPPSVPPTPSRWRRGRWIVATVVAVAVLAVAAAALSVLLAHDDSDGLTVDGFDEELASIDGTAPAANPAGVDWSVVSGAMSTSRGVLEGEPVSKGRPALAVLRFEGHVVERVGASWSTVGTGSGLVFRYRSPAYHWLLTAAPEFGSWNLYRRLDGETTFVDNIPYSARDGNEVEVRLEGDAIAVSIDGETRLTLEDPLLVGESGVGVVIGADGPEARVEKFEVTASRS